MSKINSLRWIVYWINSLIIVFSVKVIVSLVLKYFFLSGLNNPIMNSLTDAILSFIISVIVAPLFETYIFFTLILMIFVFLHKKYRLYRWTFFLFVLLSSFLFSINHSFNLSYFAYSIISGILYSIIYYKAYLKRYSPYWGVVFIHSSYNLFVFFWNI
jgi:hypothetical protein